MEIEPRFSIDKLTNTDLSFGPFKDGISPTTISTIWAATTREQSTWYMGLGTDIVPACQ
ncbi:hypothetical protein MJ561_06885 [Klebsiella pneumoniae]|nr:hypothetical protein MJ561_06885 [Klebsiella pneumoniae]